MVSAKPEQAQGAGVASYTFNNSYYLGAALGEVMGALLSSHVSVITAAVVDASTFVVSACCYRWLPNVSVPRKDGVERRGLFRQSAAVLRNRRDLTLSVVYFILAVGAFQGFHNTARTVVPVRMLHLPDSGVMKLQILTGAAVFLGAAAVPVLLHRIGFQRYLGPVMNIAASIAIIAVPRAGGETMLYVYYFVFLFLFEFAFTVAQSFIIQKCPPADLVTPTAATNAGGTGMLVVCTLATGAMSDRLDFGTVAILVAVAAITVGVAMEILARVKFVPEGRDESARNEEPMPASR